MRGNIKKIKKLDLVFFRGRMEENILVFGSMENNMGLESMYLLMAKSRLGNGLQAKDCVGLLKKKC